MVNKVMLIGNLTQPPEFKQLQNGGAVRSSRKTDRRFI